MSDRSGAIIIGSGAGGGTLEHENVTLLTKARAMATAIRVGDRLLERMGA